MHNKITIVAQIILNMKAKTKTALKDDTMIVKVVYKIINVTRNLNTHVTHNIYFYANIFS